MEINVCVLPDKQISYESRQKWKKSFNEFYAHIIAAAYYILETKPTHIIDMGDFADFPALSTHKSQKDKINDDIKKDIDEANAVLDLFFSIINSDPTYKPVKIFITGNHEDRLNRFIGENPQFKNLLKLDNLLKLEYFDKIIPFKQFYILNEVYFCHYFSDAFTGKPLAGTAEAMAKKLGFSFVMGHKQKLDICTYDLQNGRTITGLVAGAFYQHWEDYKGQANNHWRGICTLHNVKNGKYDLEVWSLKRLLNKYKDKIKDVNNEKIKLG